MPRSRPPPKRQRTALALDDAHTHLAELRTRHPDVSDAQAHLASLIVLDGYTINHIHKSQHWPKEWIVSQLTLTHVSAFMAELGQGLLVGAAHLALHMQQQLMRTAKSSYVRYAAAQDLMDRAGLRSEPTRTQATAASIMINIGVPQGTIEGPLAPPLSQQKDV